MNVMYPEAWDLEFAEQQRVLQELAQEEEQAETTAQVPPAWQICSACGNRVTAAEQLVGLCSSCADLPKAA
jgi:hypothetical protein